MEMDEIMEVDEKSGRMRDDRLRIPDPEYKLGNNSEAAEEHEMESVEKIFAAQEVPTWKRQLTFRALVVSLLLSVAFSFIVIKLSLTTGIIPDLNVAAGLLGYFFVKSWTTIFRRVRVVPFTRQENTVIQTCVVASSGIAYTGGFGNYLLGMSKRVASQSDTPNAKDFKNPSLSWMIGFLFLVSFVGLLSVVPLRKIMIVDFKLTFPSGTATAYLINSFHTPQGAKLAKKKVNDLGKYFSISFLWGFFKWFFQAADGCGFDNFPTFGLKALANSFYFDFSATYVGVGMLCPYIINISVLLGGILSWGLMWPLIEKKAGHWYPANESNMHGMQGYKVFISISMILGDGLYNFIKVLSRTLVGLYQQLQKKDDNILPVASDSSPNSSRRNFDEQERTRLFLKDKIPTSFAFAGYVAIAAISMGILPQIFPPLKWYYALFVYIIAPPLAFCNAYGCGLTGWSLGSIYGQLAVFVIGAWAGQAHGGVLAGLAAGGVMMNIVSAASYLTEDFKTGYLTLASPRSMFIVQVIGTAMGCVISPCVFWVFYKAFGDLGLPDSEYPAPYASLYRSVARLGVEGFSSLPSHCLTLCYVFFAAAIVINGVRDLAGKRWARFIPVPMAMAIPFYIGSYFAIDMCIGSLILFVSEKVNKTKADTFAPVIASGLICGEGIWTLPSSVLAMARITPPICMKFLSSSTNKRVDDFLQS